MRSFVFSATLLAASFAPLAVSAQQLLPAQSEIGFVSRQMGVPVSGRFKTFDAKLAFDPAKPTAASIAFSVDMGSASLGDRETEAELPKPVWFGVAKFPKANFQSTSVKRLDATRFEVVGMLTIKGLSNEVVVPVLLAQTGAQTVATGSFPIKRLTFRIGDQEWSDTSMVADAVQVNFRFTLTGVPKL